MVRSIGLIGDAIDQVVSTGLALRNTTEPAVFMFHSIPRPDTAHRNDPTPKHSYAVFENFLKWLQQTARIVPVAELMNSGGLLKAPAAPQLAALTFDDGHLDNYCNAYPLLRSLGLPATFYIPSGLIGRPLGMTAAMIREVSENGICIGSHSVTYPILSRLNAEQLHVELKDSKSALEDMTGSPCRDLAYPFGRYNALVKEIAAESGYEYCLGASPKESPRDRWALPRLGIPETLSTRRYAIAIRDAQVWRRQAKRLPIVASLMRFRNATSIGAV